MNGQPVMIPICSTKNKEKVSTSRTRRRDRWMSWTCLSNGKLIKIASSEQKMIAKLNARGMRCRSSCFEAGYMDTKPSLPYEDGPTKQIERLKQKLYELCYKKCWPKMTSLPIQDPSTNSWSIKPIAFPSKKLSCNKAHRAFASSPLFALLLHPLLANIAWYPYTMLDSKTNSPTYPSQYSILRTSAFWWCNSNELDIDKYIHDIHPALF